MRPGSARFRLDVLIDHRGKHDDLDEIMATKALEDAPAVQMRHHEVENDEVRADLPEPLKRLEAVGSSGHKVAFTLENHAEKVPDVLIVIDDQHATWCLDRDRAAVRYRKSPHALCFAIGRRAI